MCRGVNFGYCALHWPLAPLSRFLGSLSPSPSPPSRFSWSRGPSPAPAAFRSFWLLPAGPSPSPRLFGSAPSGFGFFLCPPPFPWPVPSPSPGVPLRTLDSGNETLEGVETRNQKRALLRRTRRHCCRSRMKENSKLMKRKKNIPLRAHNAKWASHTCWTGLAGSTRLPASASSSNLV